MATERDFERLSVPFSLGSGLFCSTSPATTTTPSPGSHYNNNNTATTNSSSNINTNSHIGLSNSDSGHNTGIDKDQLSVVARTVSRNSQGSILSSSRRSVQSIHSHVSTFQNVRFEPDPIKDISFWGGMALLISNMTGPGLITIPVVAQSAGWLPTVLGFSLVALLSTLSSLFICEAMTEVPGNEFFQSNVEYSNLVLCFFGRRYHLLVQIVCYLAMQTTNIASIAVSAQLFDNLLIKLFHRTCGIEVYPNPSFVCVYEQLPSASPFTGVMIMTAGVLLALCMILPLALLKLSENIWVQLASFILMVLIVLQWIVTFFMHGLDTTLVPIVGSDVSQTFGTILFNYAFITTVPSWANAKKPSVSIHKSIGWSVTITTVIYLLVAILGGMAFQIPANSTLIQAINSAPNATVLSQVTGYTFPIAALITSIPINIIVIRYNLIQSGACNMMWSNFLSGVLPWLIAIPCMTGSGLTAVINWSSLFLVSTANFIIPFILYIYSKKHREKLNKLPIIEMEQYARLSREVSRSSFSGHSRRGNSVSGSIRRRASGTAPPHHGSQSHGELPIAPSSALAAATIVPVALGIGTGSIIHHSVSEENLGGENSRPVHRRYHSYQNTGHVGELSGESLGGPYFSYSRDGELFEGENIGPMHGDSRSASSSVHRPSGLSTVVLHDPASELAQRKATLPRRVSHKDKILSMISDRHKRAMEQQEKIMKDQSSKPVPPMILLSQSAIESEIADDDSDQPTQCESRDPEKSDEDVKPDALEDNNTIHSAKKLNRKSYVPPTLKGSRTTLTLPSSPPPRSNPPSPMELRASAEIFRPGSPHPPGQSEHILEPSPMFSPPRIPSPQRSVMKHSPSSPNRESSQSVAEGSMRPSITLSFGFGSDPINSEDAALDSTRLGPSGSSQSGNGFMNQPPSTPDSSASVHSLDRRVSFSDDARTSLSPLDQDVRSTFSSETRRVMKAAMASLAGGGSPSRYTSNTSLNSGLKDTRPPTTEWATTLLENPEEEGIGAEDEEHEAIGPELSLANMTPPGSMTQLTDGRRDSIGRMAAAFSAQPGSFSIHTAPMGVSQPSTGTSEEYLEPPSLTISRTEPTLSPSAPPGFTLQSSARNHGRTFSASAAEDRTGGVPRQSTQSLRELTPTNGGLGSGLSVHLMPPSPSLGQHARFEGSPSPTLPSPASGAPPSPQQRGGHLGHRSSFSSRHNRLSGSSKTLPAPFQSGKNYSIPGFNSPQPSPTLQSPPIPPSPDRIRHGDSSGSSSWFRRQHSRDPSRSTIVSAQVYPAKSAPPSPRPSVLEAGGVGVGAKVELQSAGSLEALMRLSNDRTGDDGFDCERGLAGHPYHESNTYLPQYVSTAAAFDQMWSLRAIPRWVPISSLKIAWGSLAVLVLAIGATIVFAFVQLASGNDVVSGS
ncbi:hypothetical protein MVEG_03454 [Podila verticillata NRRL 6337]|nr:hypothetical protein MVEG_03454 [Podila verticillata NRRL 6337]